MNARGFVSLLRYYDYVVLMFYTGMCVKVLLCFVGCFVHTFVSCLGFEGSRVVLVIFKNYVLFVRLYRIPFSML